MTLVFVCSSREKNRELNQRIACELEGAGFGVYLPQRDTPQNSSPEIVFQRNIEAIGNSDLLVVVLDNYSVNLALEVGYAYGVGKQMVALSTRPCAIPDRMLAAVIGGMKIASAVEEIKGWLTEGFHK